MSRTRVLVGVLGMDQHELGAVGIAKMFRDEGMEVIYTGCFNTPETIVATAIEEDIDVIGISSHSWEYLYYMPELLDLIDRNELGVPVVLGGSVITDEDRATMLDRGVAAVFGSGSVVSEMVDTVRGLVAGEPAT
ncbi:MAG: methylmalonyl-CoA mutase [Actinomycetia bacterium]|nr:methylmalonyl-CoA mutase [Actinomycetes bacterium]MCP4961331.1 methylmalonyl-CoA mutase [Actinomycetes bacterium]